MIRPAGWIDNGHFQAGRFGRPPYQFVNGEAGMARGTLVWHKDYAGREPSLMPFVRTAVRQGTDASQKKLIVESIHHALVQSIGMPEDELFNLVSEYDPSDFLYSRTFNGVARSDHLVVVEITMRRGRSDAMKKALYAAIAANLEQRVGLSPKDVYIFMHENDYSDWSVGNGQFAIVLAQQRGSDL